MEERSDKAVSSDVILIIALVRMILQFIHFDP